MANLIANEHSCKVQDHLYGNTARPAWEMQLVLFPGPRQVPVTYSHSILEMEGKPASYKTSYKSKCWSWSHLWYYNNLPVVSQSNKCVLWEKWAGLTLRVLHYTHIWMLVCRHTPRPSITQLVNTPQTFEHLGGNRLSWYVLEVCWVGL